MVLMRKLTSVLDQLMLFCSLVYVLKAIQKLKLTCMRSDILLYVGTDSISLGYLVATFG